MALITGIGAQSSGSSIAAGAQGITVSTAAELHAALASAAPGTTILVAPGDYGSLSLAPGWGFNFTGDVTIAAADPNNPPLFSHIYMRDVSNVTLSGLDVQMIAQPDSVKWDSAILMENSHNITIDTVKLTGADAINGISQSADPNTTWDPSGNVNGRTAPPACRSST